MRYLRCFAFLRAETFDFILPLEGDLGRRYTFALACVERWYPNDKARSK